MTDKLTSENLIDGEHYFSIKLPIYNTMLRVFPKSEYATAFYSVDCGDPGLSAFVNIMQNGGYSEVCMVFGDAVSEFSTSTICHESIHAAWRSLDLVGVVVNSKNHEALAYLADWIFNQVEASLLPAAEKFRDSALIIDAQSNNQSEHIRGLNATIDALDSGKFNSVSEFETVNEIAVLRKFIGYLSHSKSKAVTQVSESNYDSCIRLASDYVDSVIRGNKK